MDSGQAIDIYGSLSPCDKRAVDLFRSGNDKEGKGDLDGAIALYSEAYQLCSGLDRILKKIAQAEIASKAERNLAPPLTRDRDGTDSPSESAFSRAPSTSADEGNAATSKAQSEEEENNNNDTSIICRLPPEIRTRILSELALLQPQKFVQVAVMSEILRFPMRSPLFWEPICSSLWPNDANSRLPEYGTFYDQFRRRPHVRFNGVYVATSRYYRQGERRNGQWLAPVLEVKYYRYIQLSRNGDVRTLLSNDPPKTTLPQFLRPGICPRVQRGCWVLDDESGILVLVTEDKTRNYDFRMDLEIASSGGKVSNKLKWRQYCWTERKLPNEGWEQINTATERPFYFFSHPSLVRC